jgi:hypothetical protein
MSVLSASSVLELHTKVLGSEPGRLYNVLWNEIIRIRVKWQEYCGLFQAGPKTIATLNAAAPFFFYIVQDLLLNDIILGLARITSRKTVDDKANLTVAWLPEKMPDAGDLRTLDRLVSEAIAASRFTKDRRNRYIAHRDYALFVRQTAKPLRPIKRRQVEGALSALWKIIEHCESCYFKSSTIDQIVRPMTGVFSLLHFLSEAQRSLRKPERGST